MSAHFIDNMVTVPRVEEITSSNSDVLIRSNSYDLLKLHILEFRKDPSKMIELCSFIDDILLQAIETVNEKQLLENIEEEDKSKSYNKSHIRGLNNRMGNISRGFFGRILNKICNCANNAINSPVPIIMKLTRKRSSTTATTIATTNATTNATTSASASTSTSNSNSNSNSNSTSTSTTVRHNINKANNHDNKSGTIKSNSANGKGKKFDKLKINFSTK